MAVKIFTGPSSAANSGKYLPEHFETSYEGAVIALWEQNGYDDSDFVALVWDAEKEHLTTTTYATTRGWTYANSAAKDATEEILALAREDVVRRWTERIIENDRESAAKVAVGRRVRSLTTRGKAKGLVGEVVWLGETRYGRAAKVQGILPSGERVERFVDPERLEVIDTVEIISEHQARHEAENRVDRQGLVSCYRALSWG